MLQAFDFEETGLPTTELYIQHHSCYTHHRLKEEHVLLSADGPYRNVLKFKPPMCFTREDVDEVVSKLDEIFTEIDDGEADVSEEKFSLLMNGEQKEEAACNDDEGGCNGNLVAAVEDSDVPAVKRVKAAV